MRCLFLFLFLSSFVQAQSWQKSRITVSGGSTRQLFGYSYDHEKKPLVGLSYGYRPLKFMEFEAGAEVALQPGPTMCTQYGCYDPDDRYIRVPFGVRLIAPLVARRVELSAGGGGLYQKYSDRNPSKFSGTSTSRSNWGGYFSAGAAVALDRRHRFWAGVTPRVILANPPHTVNRWFTITGDFSLRF